MRAMTAVLKKRLAKTRAVFDVDAMAALHANKVWVQTYYRVNRIPYTLFHSADNILHVGVTREGGFKRADLFAQPALVNQYVRSRNAKNVLELAAGRGPNSAYLAARNPETECVGVDRSEVQLKIARKAAAKYENFSVLRGDYHDLSRFQSGSFDIVFIVEAFCYSEDKPRVFAEARRILRAGGLFIIYEGFRRAGDAAFSEDQRLAASLVERGVAINRYETHDRFCAMAREAGFEIFKEEDLTQAAIPTCARFERLARGFFKFPPLARAIVKVLPVHFAYNAVAGYFLTELLRQRVFGYWLIVLKAPQTENG